MAKVPLQNVTAWSYIRTVEEATTSVSKWPEWKRERQLFSRESRESNGSKSERKQDSKSS